MVSLSPRGLGFAFAGIAAVFYLGCAFVMSTVPRDVAIRFFNSLTHGVDWGPIMRWDMPWTEALAGLLGVFILGWLTGAAVAALYNIGARTTA
jgi:hypothetical protein